MTGERTCAKDRYRDSQCKMSLKKKKTILWVQFDVANVQNLTVCNKTY